MTLDGFGCPGELLFNFAYLHIGKQSEMTKNDLQFILHDVLRASMSVSVHAYSETSIVRWALYCTST